MQITAEADRSANIEGGVCMRWSRLQRLIYDIWVEKLGLQIHCNAFDLSGSASVGRWWITLDRDIIWDVPKDFPEERAKGTYNLVATEGGAGRCSATRGTAGCGDMRKSLVGTRRFLSLILRHDPGRIGLTLDEVGWASVEEGLACLKPLSRGG